MGERTRDEKPWLDFLNLTLPVQFSSAQLLSRVQLFATPWTAARQASLSITNSRSPPKPMPIEWVMPSNHLNLCRPLLLLPSIFPSIRVFSNESAVCIRWPKYWSFSFKISPTNEHPGLISFRMDWLDLLAVQGTLKSLLQHHSSKVSILLCSAFFIVQLTHPYMTTGKTIALTRWTFVSKVMSLLFNMLSRSVITFLPRSKCLLISWLQSPSAVILEPPKNVCTPPAKVRSLEGHEDHFPYSFYRGWAHSTQKGKGENPREEGQGLQGGRNSGWIWQKGPLGRGMLPSLFPFHDADMTLLTLTIPGKFWWLLLIDA